MKPTSVRVDKNGFVVTVYGQPDIQATARIMAPRILEEILRDLEEKNKDNPQPKKAG
jgi:hypothetical protein